MTDAKPLAPVDESAQDSAATRVADALTAMTPRFGSFASLFGRRFFAGFGLKADEAARLRELGERGSVIYVMRYSSRLDYFLFNWLFLAAGLKLSSFANGIHFF